MIVVACQYELEGLTWDLYVKKMEFIVLAAKQKNAELILLPEYSGLEVAGMYDTDEETFAAIQPRLPKFLKLFGELAEQYKVYILAGTIPVKVSEDKYVNRAYFFGIDGKHGYQDKLQLVEFENGGGLIAKGEGQTIFETPLGKIGVAICYDSEFPEIVRSLTQAGAMIILVPSYAISQAGYTRVAVSCRARAIENQCYVITAFAIGEVKLGCIEPEQLTGKSAVFGPADYEFPDTGIVANSTFNETAMVAADLDLKKIAQVRANGAVRNFQDSQKLKTLNLTTLKL